MRWDFRRWPRMTWPRSSRRRGCERCSRRWGYPIPATAAHGAVVGRVGGSGDQAAGVHAVRVIGAWMLSSVENFVGFLQELGDIARPPGEALP